MKKTAFIITILSAFVLINISPASGQKELPKTAVWDLEANDVPPSYVRTLTSVLVSEVTKVKRYEVYSQENVRTVAGWTAERMKLGCTDTQCLVALGQMDIAKLISGSVSKIGNRYSVSLNLFDTQKVKAEKAVSEFCHSEDELIDLVQIAVRKLLGETATDWYERGLKEKGHEAIRAFSRAIELDPLYAEAYCWRGMEYVGLGYYQTSIKDFDRAIELDRKYSLAYSFRGAINLNKLGNYQQAIKDYDRCIELEPGYKPYYIRRGQVHLKIGDYQQAIKDFDGAIKVKTDDYGLGRKLQENDVDAYAGRGQVYLKIGNYQQAIKDYDKAIELDPKDAVIYYYRGLVYDHLGDRQKALRDYKIAARLGDKEVQDYLKSQGIEW
jgi:tetratricopeptide (TPR) repeat protein